MITFKKIGTSWPTPLNSLHKLQIILFKLHKRRLELTGTHIYPRTQVIIGIE